MKITILIRAGLLLVILGLGVEVLAMSKLTVRSSPVPEVTLTNFNEDTFPELEQTFKLPGASGTQAAAVVVTNTSNRKIMGIAVVWVYTDELGHQTHRSLRCDSFSSLPQRPVALPHSRLLVTPTFMLPESQAISGSYLAAVTGAQQQIAAVAKSVAVSAELDLVIFEDGEVAGPDQRNHISQIEAHRAAASAIIQQLHAETDDAAVTTILSQLASIRPDAGDYVRTAQRRIAQRLLRSRNLQRDIETLQQLPSLPKFYRR